MAGNLPWIIEIQKEPFSPLLYHRDVYGAAKIKLPDCLHSVAPRELCPLLKQTELMSFLLLKRVTWAVAVWEAGTAS